MRNRVLAASAVVLLASARLLLAPSAANAGPISSYPAATTPLAGSETVIGTQSGSTVQITAQSIGNLAKPAGSAGQVQYDNAGVFGGAGNVVIESTTGILDAYPSALGSGVNINLPYGETGSPAVVGQIALTAITGVAGNFGDGYCLGESLTLALGNCALEWGGGGGGSGSPSAQAIQVGADVTNFVIPSTVTMNLPDRGAYTDAGLQLGSTTSNSGVALTVSSSGAHLPTPVGVANGAAAAGIESTPYRLYSPAGIVAGTLGFIVEGWNEPCTGDPDCGNVDYSPGNDLTLMDHYGHAALSLVTGLPQFGLVGIGQGAAPTCIQANEGCGTVATFTGTISGSALTASSVTGTLAIGQLISGVGVLPGTMIVSGTGPYTLNNSQSVSSESMAGSWTYDQLILADQTLGTLGAPQIVFQVEAGGHNVGVGGAGPAEPDFRYGCVGNDGTPWDDRVTLCPATIDVEAGYRTGYQNGSAGEWSGGTGVTWDIWLRDCNQTAGGMFCVYNDGATATMPISVAFVRLKTGTVSGLATLDASPTDGDRAYVTDAIACTFASAVTGGGSTHCPVYYDGSSSSWKAG